MGAGIDVQWERSIGVWLPVSGDVLTAAMPGNFSASWNPALSRTYIQKY